MNYCTHGEGDWDLFPNTMQGMKEEIARLRAALTQGCCLADPKAPTCWPIEYCRMQHLVNAAPR